MDKTRKIKKVIEEIKKKRRVRRKAKKTQSLRVRTGAKLILPNLEGGTVGFNRGLALGQQQAGGSSKIGNPPINPNANFVAPNIQDAIRRELQPFITLGSGSSLQSGRLGMATPAPIQPFGLGKSLLSKRDYYLKLYPNDPAYANYLAEQAHKLQQQGVPTQEAIGMTPGHADGVGTNNSGGIGTASRVNAQATYGSTPYSGHSGAGLFTDGFGGGQDAVRKPNRQAGGLRTVPQTDLAGAFSEVADEGRGVASVPITNPIKNLDEGETFGQQLFTPTQRELGNLDAISVRPRIDTLTSNAVLKDIMQITDRMMQGIKGDIARGQGLDRMLEEYKRGQTVDFAPGMTVYEMADQLNAQMDSAIARNLEYPKQRLEQAQMFMEDQKPQGPSYLMEE